MKIVQILLLVIANTLFTNSFSQKWEWVKRVNGAQNDSGISMDVDDSGYVYLTGRCKWATIFEDETSPIGPVSLGDRDVFVAKYTSQGALIWASIAGATTLGYDYAWDVVADNTGGCYITGLCLDNSIFGTDTMSTFDGTTDAFVSRLDHDGNFVWTRIIGGSGTDRGYGISLDHSGNVLFCGEIHGVVNYEGIEIGTATRLNGYYGRMDINGNLIDLYCFKSNYYSAINKIICDDIGDIYLCGGFSGSAIFDSTSFLTGHGFTQPDAFWTKCDSTFNLIHLSSGGSIYHDIATNIATTSGSVYIVGTYTWTAQFDTITSTFNSSASGSTVAVNNARDMFIASYNDTAGINWFKGIGSEGYDEALGVAVSNKNNIYFSGYFKDSVSIDDTILFANGSSANSLIVRLDEMGNLVWAKESGNSFDSHAARLAIDSYENIFVPGEYSNFYSFDGIEHTSTARDAFGGKLTQHVYPNYSLNGTSFCQGDTLIISLYGLTSPITYSYVSGDSYTSWMDSTNIYYILEYGPTMDITGTLFAENNVYVDSLFLNFEVIVSPLPIPTLPADTVICENELSYILMTDSFFESYFWSTGDLGTYFIEISDSGEYSVSVIDSLGCSGFNSTNVAYINCLDVDTFSDQESTFLYSQLTKEIYFLGSNFSGPLLVCDMNGRVVVKKNIISPSEIISLNQLQSGVYLVYLLDDSGAQCQKIVITP